VTTCFAAQLLKPRRDDPNQNHYYGAQTSSKLARTIHNHDSQSPGGEYEYEKGKKTLSSVVVR
jgi:hypothetical protein